MEPWEYYKNLLDQYREQLENGNQDVEQDVVDLQENLEREIDMIPDDRDSSKYRKVLKELKAMKEEFDFYDEEGERKMMFPNGDDEDFD